MSSAKLMISHPAIRLYRAILKAHRSRLPQNMRELGDSYVRNEFKLHKTAKPDFVLGFMEAWQGYYEMLMHQHGNIGKSLSDEEKKKLTDDQSDRLNKLKEEVETSMREK